MYCPATTSQPKMQNGYVLYYAILFLRKSLHHKCGQHSDKGVHKKEIQDTVATQQQ